MKVLVCGDRNWDNIEAIARELKKLPEGTVIVHGAARGADTIAGLVAEEIGFVIEAYPADWNKYGKGAGHIRNKQMLDEGKPKIVFAFHSDIGSSKGTKNMVEQANKAGIITVIFKE